MTVDYKKPSLREYKELIRYDAKLTGEIKIAELLNEDLKTVELKQEKKLLGIRIKIIEASFILKHKWVKSYRLDNSSSEKYRKAIITLINHLDKPLCLSL